VPLEPGLVGSAALTVGDADTADALGSGDVPVLATPRVVLLAERATVAAIAGQVERDETTVGYRVQLDHLAPVPVGDDVSAEAVLESIEGRRLTFRVSVKHRDGLVAAGRITRVVVARSRFLGKAAGTE
jgi:predicted thioesterase